MKKRRLDEILIERGIVRDKKEAFIEVTEGNIFVEGQKAVTPAQMVPIDVSIREKLRSRYVGRGGYKLEAALKNFPISAEGKICADIGAATGGFSDAMLQNGAKKVYAIDTGKGKLADKIRRDSRVVPMEGVNILYLESLPEPVEFAGIDLSFTSQRFVLPALIKFLAPRAEIVTLFKPQYEVREYELSHGVVKDESVRNAAVLSFETWLSENGWQVRGKIESPILGSKGNKEYLFYLVSA